MKVIDFGLSDYIRPGVYVDDGDIKKVLGEKYGNISVSELKEKNKELFDDLMESDICMTVRLQIVYGRLSIRSVRSAFEESVGTRLQKFGGADNKELLQRFTSQFKDEYKIPRGSIIDLSREQGNVIRTAMFEYNKQFHNVIRVTHKNFNACNATAPYFTLNSGNDSFTITRGGHFYFICSLPSHCEAGQKVDIRVPKTTNTTAPHPTSSPAPAPHQTPQSPPLSSPSLSPSPPVLLSPVPAPNVPAPQNSASSLSKVWLSIVVLAFSVSGFAY